MSSARSAGLTAAALLLILGLALLAGCGHRARDAGEQSQSLVIYAARNENLVGELIQRFSETTGIETLVKYGSTSEIASTLNEEGANGPADVFYARDPGGLLAVSDLLGPLPDDILDSVPQWARSAGGNWVGVSARARVVVYNTDRLAESDLPQSIEDFVKPEWKGRVGWSPTSGPTPDDGDGNARAVGRGQDAALAGGHQEQRRHGLPQPHGHRRGRRRGRGGRGLVNHYYLLRFLEERGQSFPVRNYHLPRGGPGNLVIVVGAGILETAQNRANAERFLRFLLSAEAQR